MFIFQSADLIGAIIQTIVFVYVIRRIIDGAMTPGDFAALFAFWGGLRGPAFELSWNWIRMQDIVAEMRRGFALMDMPPEDDMGDIELPPIGVGISMRTQVGLVYSDGRRALQDVSFDAKVGEIVAFVGPTGVTYVFQETQLFSDSIPDNIRYGKPDADQTEVERVAKIAGVHDFIASLPEGCHSRIGTAAGSKLSVGQKQRISIARGLLRESKVLILDEPTSALDPETEECLVRALHEAANDRVVIIIAHRLSTIANADRIVFLEAGRVVEQGSHDELVALENGHYRAFVELQTRAR